MGCTIIEIANQVMKYNTIVIDLVAMCLNDYLSKKNPISVLALSKLSEP